MDTLVVTLDVHLAAIEGHDATKGGLVAVKRGAVTARSVSIVRVEGLLAVKCKDCERTRVYFAVIREDHAVMGGRNAAKGLSLAAMRVHHAVMAASNVAMEAPIAAKCAFNLAT